MSSQYLLHSCSLKKVSMLTCERFPAQKYDSSVSDVNSEVAISGSYSLNMDLEDQESLFASSSGKQTL